jgi:hypothetical protein
MLHINQAPLVCQMNPTNWHSAIKPFFTVSTSPDNFLEGRVAVSNHVPDFRAVGYVVKHHGNADLKQVPATRVVTVFNLLLKHLHLIFQSQHDKRSRYNHP